MAKNIVHKILEAHLVSGTLNPGSEVGISIDHTLIHDATGTMALLQFEALGIPRVKTKRSVAYIDHNTLQTSFENMDDHRFIESACRKFGIYVSRPGNGICHQVNLERFSVPGDTLLGADSHTTTAGGVGMLAIGAGGLDVAVAMAGGPFYLSMPRVLKVELKGALPPWSSAKDVILEILRRLTVSGGYGKILEFAGAGVKSLSATERATIANMSIESGAFTAIFPSDEVTRRYFQAQARGEDWQRLEADRDAVYDEEMVLDLSSVEPLIAKPHLPDNVVPVKEVAGKPVDQVAIGSCTNSSLEDMLKVASILKGHVVPPGVSLIVSPGSRQVLLELAERGALSQMIAAGARILESTCGPCIGMGQAPCSKGVTLRTFNRNFKGRSGTADALIYLVSPETAAASALRGVIADPRDLGDPVAATLPERFLVDDSLIMPPRPEERETEIVRGPNIQPLPRFDALPEELEGEVLLMAGDNITTDDIIPGGSKILPLRSNIPAISRYVFSQIDANFVNRAEQRGGGFILAGRNYGQGSSREHAALAPRFLGVRAVLAQSFARIHRANLINFGILPLEFVNEDDLKRFSPGDQLRIGNLIALLAEGKTLLLENVTQGFVVETYLDLSQRLREVILAGGLLEYTRENSKTGPQEGQR
ncbi:MAG: aconitate hydratase [Deltaproteobacteria bacterium]|nr:MAG: aconitate hydratase [Deltaproteobacteria bacterium]